MPQTHKEGSVLWIAAIVAFGFFLRFYGIRFGLPYLYHQDEPVTVGVALKFGTGSLNPHYFAHPHLLHYMLFGLYGVMFLIGLPLRLWRSVSEFQGLFFRDPSLFYGVGRGLCALLGTATLLVIYFYGKRLYGRTVGLLGALFLATSFLHVRSSHYVRHDVPVVFMILLSSLAIFHMGERGRRKDFFFAGLLSGLTVATNWNGAILLAPLVLGLFLRKDPPKTVLVNLATVCGGGLVGLFAGSPFLFLDLRGSLQEFRRLFSSLVPSHPTGAALGGGIPLKGWSSYLFHYLRVGMGWPLEILGILGLLFLLVRHQKEDILFLSLPILYFCLIGSIHSSVRAEYILPVLPYLYLSAAVFLVWVTQRLKDAKRIVCFGIFIPFCMALPTVQSIRHDYLITLKDTRTVAKEWIERHIPQGSRIAMERYISLRSWVPPLLETKEQNLKMMQAIRQNDPTKGKMREGLSSQKSLSPRYTLIEITPDHRLLEEFESGYSLEALLKKKVDHVILSSFVSDFKRETRDPRVGQLYKDLQERAQLVKRFTPFREEVSDERQDHASYTPLDRLHLLERPGPVIEIYFLGKVQNETL